MILYYTERRLLKMFLINRARGLYFDATKTEFKVNYKRNESGNSIEKVNVYQYKVCG